MHIDQWYQNYNVRSNTISDVDVTRGQLIVEETGSAHNVVVRSTGYITVKDDGVIDHVDVQSGGMIRLLGGTASNIYVHEGGIMHIKLEPGCEYHGTSNHIPFDVVDGQMDNFMPHGKVTITSGCSLCQVDVGSDQTVQVDRGGVLVDAIAHPYGTITVLVGGIASITESGGRVLNEDTDDVTYAPSVISGSTITWPMTVHSATLFHDVTIAEDGKVTVFRNSDVQNIVVNGGKLTLTQYANVSYIRVLSGDLQLKNYATAHKVKFHRNTTCTMMGSSVLSESTIVNGCVVRIKNAEITSCHINGRVVMPSVNGVSYECHIHQGGQFYCSGASMVNPVVHSGGYLKIKPNSHVNNLTVLDGGLAIVYNGSFVDKVKEYGEVKYVAGDKET